MPEVDGGAMLSKQRRGMIALASNVGAGSGGWAPLLAAFVPRIVSDRCSAAALAFRRPPVLRLRDPAVCDIAAAPIVEDRPGLNARFAVSGPWGSRLHQSTLTNGLTVARYLRWRRRRRVAEKSTGGGGFTAHRRY